MLNQRTCTGYRKKIASGIIAVTNTWMLKLLLLYRNSQASDSEGSKTMTANGRDFIVAHESAGEIVEIPTAGPQLPTEATSRPELFFGLVAAVGTDLDIVANSLSESLAKVGYTTRDTRLIEKLHQFARWSSLPESPLDVRTNNTHMTAGNEFREALARGDALAVLVSPHIRDQLRRKDTDAPNRVLI